MRNSTNFWLYVRTTWTCCCQRKRSTNDLLPSSEYLKRSKTIRIPVAMKKKKKFQGKTVRQNSIHSSPILATINPMETLPEMDESKESTPPNEQSRSLLPSISSSSNSPNSVKVNQTYLKSQQSQLSAQNETFAIELNATMNNTKLVANNVDNLSLECNDNINLVNCSGSSSALLDVDTEASTPLLDAKNSTNSNAINSGYSDSEKEALIFNSNSIA